MPLGLRITGFGRQRRVPVERLVSALELLPRAHLDGLREIEHDPGRVGPKSVGYFLSPRVYTPLPNLRCEAEYLQDEERIAAYKFADEADFLHLVLHEVGHHVCQRSIGGNLRKRWVTQIYPATAAVSRASARKDFAESYALFAINPERLRAFPQQYTFMRDEVLR